MEYSQLGGMTRAPWARGGDEEERKDRGRSRRRGRAGGCCPLEPAHRHCDTHISQCPIKSHQGRPHAHQHTHTHTHTLQGAPGPSGETMPVNKQLFVQVCVWSSGQIPGILEERRQETGKETTKERMEEEGWRGRRGDRGGEEETALISPKNNKTIKH